MIQVRGGTDTGFTTSVGFVLHDGETHQLFHSLGNIPRHEAQRVPLEALNAEIIRKLRQGFESKMKDLEYVLKHQKRPGYVINIDCDESGPLVNTATW